MTDSLNPKSKFGTDWLITATQCMVLAALTIILPHAASSTAQAVSTKPEAMAKDANPDWEVATVKPSDPNDGQGQHIRFRGRHVMLIDHTIEEILLIGYGVQKSQLVGEPEWAKTELWDVDGIPNVEGQPSLKQLQEMMQKILLERFGLKLHHEQREMPVFALTVSKGGPKLTPNTSDPDGMMDQQNSNANVRDVEVLKNASMPDLALILQFRVDRPVVNQTGLKGRYDFKLQWTMDDTQTIQPDAPPGLFTAIQEQLGIKLDPVKAPVDVLVIDQVQKPSPN
jgi:uncharacterized protein (TIGR03435 family)